MLIFSFFQQKSCSKRKLLQLLVGLVTKPIILKLGHGAKPHTFKGGWTGIISAARAASQTGPFSFF